jgi:hypothetical protein
MNELQKLFDKVPAYDNAIAMRTIEQELGRPPHEIYQDLSPDPIAAASLGQVSYPQWWGSSSLRGIYRLVGRSADGLSGGVHQV